MFVQFGQFFCHKLGTWLQRRDGRRRCRSAKRLTVRGDVIGLTVSALHVPMVRPRSNRGRLSVADIAVFTVLGVEPTIQLRVGGHLGKFVAGYLRLALLLGFRK